MASDGNLSLKSSLNNVGGSVFAEDTTMHTFNSQFHAASPMLCIAPTDLLVHTHKHTCVSKPVAETFIKPKTSVKANERSTYS